MSPMNVKRERQRNGFTSDEKDIYIMYAESISDT